MVASRLLLVVASCAALRADYDNIASIANTPHTALDDYIGTLSPNYTWFDTNATVSPLLIRATAHIINVTSQQWLTEAEAVGPNGALWTHQVAVIVPHELKHPELAITYLTGNCNEDPKPPANDDEELLLISDIAAQTGIIGVLVWQLPNCHIIYPSDPSKKHRSEDAMIAWAWKEYLDDPKHDARWLPRLPMVKAAFSCMRAAQEWAHQKAIAEIASFTVGGASKRGWTTWMVGAAAPVCEWCPKIEAILPLVPIVPYLNHSVHLQRRSLGGFTFAFRDYLNAGVLHRFDTPEFASLLSVVDPANYLDRLALIPKFAVVSSDDEFMQLDWTQHGWTQMPGETHLLVVPNSEHSLATGIPNLIGALGGFVGSLAAKQTAADRPAFTYAKDTTSGALTVNLTSGPAPEHVYLRHAQTMSDQRRDFRWVRLANETTSPCVLPGIKLKKEVEGGGNCVQPMIWHRVELKKAADGTYTAHPPPPTKAGHYTGYYIEMIYPSVGSGRMQVSTPGFAWPDALPFADCALRKGVPNACSGDLV